MTNKIVSIVFMIIGASLVISVGLFALDNATSAEPEGLGTWISTVLGLLLGASAGIKGWLDWNKKESASQVMNITAKDGGQVSTGNEARNIQAKEYYEHFHEASKPAPTFSPLHQLPPPPADFTGREQLITDLLKDFESHKGATISGLTGMGGIGKTALGLAVAHQIAKDYPDVQIFLDLKGITAPLTLVDIARHVILSFEPTADLRALNEDNVQAAYQSVLHGKKVFLFFDNARSAEQIAKLAPPENCAMLVTSRWNFTVAGLKTHKVGVMEEQEAKEFLLELCPRIGDKASDLAKACGKLPLALRIAGSFLKVNAQWKVEKYLEELKSAKGRLETLKSSRLSAELYAEPDVLATFELSYNGLQDDQKKNWRALGVFPASFASSAAAAIWEMEVDETENLLGLLLRYSLIDFNETSTRYELHDLLAEFTRGQMVDEEEQETRIKHASHYKDVMSVANALYEEGGEKILQGLRLFDLEWEHIRSAHVWLAEHLETSKEIAGLAVLYPDASLDCLDLRLAPKQKIEWLNVALSASRKLGVKYAEGALLGNLGIVFKNLGDARKAIQLHEQAQVIHREIGDRRGESRVLGNLGVAYADLGEVRKAIELYEQCLTLLNEIGDRRAEGSVLGNLGVAYADLGEIRKAIELYERQLVIVREIGDRRGESTALCNLGLAYYTLGDPHKAIKFYEQALVIDREIGDRRGEGATLGNLGTSHATLGEIGEAIKSFEQQLSIACEISDPFGQGVALGNLGVAYANLKDKERAIFSTEQAVKVFESIESPYAQQARNQLSRLRGETQTQQEQMKIQDFVHAVIQAHRTKSPQAEGLFVSLGKMASDKNTPPEVQAVAKVLRKFMSGMNNPDLSGLPDELAQIVRKELE